jgi:hypothetical protein
VEVYVVRRGVCELVVNGRAPRDAAGGRVVDGAGGCAGSDGVEREFGPNAILIFDKGETHAVRALDEELVFVGFLHGVEGTRPGKVGGLLADS